VFPGSGRPPRRRFRRVRSVRVRRHRTADKRVPAVPDPPGRPRPHRHRVLRNHVLAKPVHVFDGNPLRGALFQAVQAVLPDQRGRVRAQVCYGHRQPVPARVAAVGRLRPRPVRDVRDASHGRRRRGAPDEAPVRPGRGRRPERLVRRPAAVVPVRPVHVDRDRHLQRDVREVHSGQVTGVPLRVADALFIQTVRDRVDDAFHDETGVLMMVLQGVCLSNVVSNRACSYTAAR